MVSASGPAGTLRRVSTLPDGTFHITGLPAGNHLLCAEATIDRPKADPFVNSCQWMSAKDKPVALVAGKEVAGVVVPMQRGHRFVVRVNDPGKQLPQGVGKNTGTHLFVSIAGPDGLRKNIPVATVESGGRTHQIVIPFSVAHNLVVHSSTFILSDPQGSAFAPGRSSTIVATPTVRPPDFVVNLSKGVTP